MNSRRHNSEPNATAAWRTRCATAVAVGALAASSLLSPTPARAVSNLLQSTTAPAALADASATAQSSGNPVVVTQDTTDTTEVTAEPDGQFLLDTSAVPVRVPDGNDGWKPVDTTLITNPDGTISPAATTVNVKFSGGGAGPAVILGSSAHHVDFTLPTSLPVPTLHGPTATYANIYPGIDLTLSASATGYSEVLVVHNATAAANPVLQNLKISTDTSDMTLTQSQDTLEATGDPSAQYESSEPIMWDSSTNASLGPTPSATDPGSGRVTDLQTNLTSSNTATDSTGTLDVSAPSSAMTGANVTYPIYIDPSMSATVKNYDTVYSSGHHYWDTGDPNLAVGYCNPNWYGCNSMGVARSFFTLNTSPLAGAGTPVVNKATLYAYQIWNGTSASTPVDLYSVYPISSSTTWPGPTRLSNLESQSSSCGGGGKAACNLAFSNSNVVAYFQRAANGSFATDTFGLISPDESQSPGNGQTTGNLDWKRFSTSPRAEVYFNYPPKTPSALHISPTSSTCGSTVYTNSATPTMYATSTDTNPANYGGSDLGISVKLYRKNDSDSSPILNRTTRSPIRVTTNSSGTGSAAWIPFSTTNGTTNTTSTGPLYGATWQFVAQATSTASGSATTSSAWSSPFNFVYESTANGPTTPTITVGATTGPDANGNTWTPITFTSNGAWIPWTNGNNSHAPTVGFAWAIANDTIPIPGSPSICSYPTNTAIPAPTANQAPAIISAGKATATYEWPNLRPGTQIHAEAFDNAHNYSPSTANITINP